MTLTSRIRVDLSALVQQVLDLAQAEVPNRFSKQYDIASGVGTAGADLVFADERTLAASGSETLDLAGVLVDSFGAVITFARIKALLVFAIDGNTNDVHVGVGASNGLATLFPVASSHVKVKPGGTLLCVMPGAGVTVTPGTGDLLTVANSGAGTGVTYRVVIIGASS
jgi:hypothetical protein